MMTRLATMTAVALLIAAPAVAQDTTAPAQTAPQATPAPATPDAPATTGTMKSDPMKTDTMTTPATGDTAAATTAAPASRYVATQASDQVLASDLIGTAVKGPADEDIGDVNDVLLDRDGNVIAAIVGVGGFLGVGEKDVAVSFNSLEVVRDNDDDEILVLRQTKEELENAPGFKTLADIRSDQGVTTPAAGTTGTTAPTTTQ